MRPLDTSRLEGAAERVRRSHHEAIRELQGLTGIQRVVIRNVQLNGTTVSQPTNVAHGLGREPSMVKVSPPRVTPANLGTLTAGLIVDAGTVEFNGTTPIDRSKRVQLGAFGFTVPIVVDVELS